MRVNFPQKYLIGLQVACACVETYDAQEHILVVSKICICLEVIDVCMLVQPEIDRKMPVSPPIISESQELSHHNLLLAHLFVALTKAQATPLAMQRFLILTSKNGTIAALIDASFPLIASTDNIATPYVTPRTIAYIHAFIVDITGISLHHSDALNEVERAGN
jgi:hypothetical protein